MAELNLDRLQPERHTLRFHDVTYMLPGAPPIQTVIRGIVLDQQLSDAERLSSDAAERSFAAQIQVAEATTVEEEEQARVALRAAEDDDRAATEQIKTAAEEMYGLVCDLLLTGNPDLEIGGFTADQRAAYAGTVKELTRVDVPVDGITDAVLAAAGVQREPGLMLTLEDCMAILGMVTSGRTVSLPEAVADTVNDPRVEVDAELVAAGEVPPTPSEAAPTPTGRAKARPRTRSAKPSRSASSG